MSKKWLAVPAAALIVVGTAGAASAVTSWNQGFETGTDGWYGGIQQVSSGANGVTSASGKFHALVNGGEFSRFAGYSDTWDGAYVAELAVYLDPAWELGTGFDYSVAANGSDGAHQRDYIFHVAKDTNTGALLVGGSNNSSNSTAREDLENYNHHVVAEAGWYTLQHSFYEKDGALAVDLNLLDADGELLWKETRFTAADTIPGEVGGNRYAWFTFATVPDLAIDNHKLYPVTKQASMDQCRDGAWESLGFKNQGQCIAGVVANQASGK